MKYSVIVLTRVVGSETKDDVSIVGHGDGVLGRGMVELTVEQTLPVQVEGVFQIDLLDGGVGWSANTNNVEWVAVQMERMAQVGLLDCEQKDFSKFNITKCVPVRKQNKYNKLNKIMWCKNQFSV